MSQIYFQYNFKVGKLRNMKPDKFIIIIPYSEQNYICSKNIIPYFIITLRLYIIICKLFKIYLKIKNPLESMWNILYDYLILSLIS